MLFPVDNDGCDLLIHEDQDRAQQCRNNRDHWCPPWVMAQWVNEPTSSAPSGSKLLRHAQLRRLHGDEEVGEGHWGDGDDDCKVGDEPANAGREKVLRPELLQVVGHEKGANEEEDAHEEGVRVVVAAGCLHPVHEGVVDVELDDENELFVDILSKQNGKGLFKNTVPLQHVLAKL